MSKWPHGRVEAMRKIEWYQQLLEMVSPWTASRVELSVEGERVDFCRHGCARRKSTLRLANAGQV